MHRMQTFVAAILYPSAYQAVFVHREDGNISGLNNSVDVELSLTPIMLYKLFRI